MRGWQRELHVFLAVSALDTQSSLQQRVVADDEEVADAHDSEDDEEADSSEEEDEQPQTRSEAANGTAKAGAAAALDQHLGAGVGWVEDDEAEAGAPPVAGDLDRPTPMSSNCCFFVCGIRLLLGIKYDALSSSFDMLEVSRVRKSAC